MSKDQAERRKQMRDRLIDLLKQADFDYTAECCEISENGSLPYPPLEERFAANLLANGVIVPPVKVGQTVYYLHEYVNRVYEGEVTSFIYVSDTNRFGIHYDGGYGIFGRYVFLTREEAEKALAERYKQ